MHLFMSQEHENVHSYKNQTNAHMEVYKYINQKKKKRTKAIITFIFLSISFLISSRLDRETGIGLPGLERGMGDSLRKLNESYK